MKLALAQLTEQRTTQPDNRAKESARTIAARSAVPHHHNKPRRGACACHGQAERIGEAALLLAAVCEFVTAPSPQTLGNACRRASALHHALHTPEIQKAAHAL